VIKVERPGRSGSARAYDSGLASHFVWTNHSQQSLASDLKERFATLRLAHHHEALGGSYTGKPHPAVIIQEDSFDTTVSVTLCSLTTDATWSERAPDLGRQQDLPHHRCHPRQACNQGHRDRNRRPLS
jgi:hypothetical protein